MREPTFTGRPFFTQGYVNFENRFGSTDTFKMAADQRKMVRAIFFKCRNSWNNTRNYTIFGAQEGLGCPFNFYILWPWCDVTWPFYELTRFFNFITEGLLLWVLSIFSSTRPLTSAYFRTLSQLSCIWWIVPLMENVCYCQSLPSNFVLLGASYSVYWWVQSLQDIQDGVKFIWSHMFHSNLPPLRLLQKGIRCARTEQF